MSAWEGEGVRKPYSRPGMSADAQGERDLRWEIERLTDALVTSNDLWKTAEARVQRQGEEIEQWHDSAKALHERALDAEARVQQLEDALREIRDEEGHGESPAPVIVQRVREIARVALGEERPETGMGPLNREGVGYPDP
jgi:hypothetical protein